MGCVMDPRWSRAVSSVVLKTPVFKQFIRMNARKTMTALESALYLSQTVFQSNFRCLFESSQENQMDGLYYIRDRSDKFSQMGFHDVRYQLSVTEGLHVPGFCLPQRRWLSYATWGRTFRRKSQEMICTLI